MLKRGEPSFTLTFILSVVPLAVLGWFAGVEVHDVPEAIVATTLFIVAIIDVLGLVRYVVWAGERRENTRLRTVYQGRAKDPQIDATVRRSAADKVLDLETTRGQHDGAWLLLPQFAVTAFAVAMAIAALVDR